MAKRIDDLLCIVKIGKHTQELRPFIMQPCGGSIIPRWLGWSDTHPLSEDFKIPTLKENKLQTLQSYMSLPVFEIKINDNTLLAYDCIASTDGSDVLYAPVFGRWVWTTSAS